MKRYIGFIVLLTSVTLWACPQGQDYPSRPAQIKVQASTSLLAAVFTSVPTTFDWLALSQGNSSFDRSIDTPLEQSHKKIVLVALERQEPIGMIYATFVNAPVLPRHQKIMGKESPFVQIQWIEIHPQVRNQGVAQHLQAAVARWAKNLGAQWLFAEAIHPAMKRSAEQFGFHIIIPLPIPWEWADVLDDYTYKDGWHIFLDLTRYTPQSP